MGNLRKWLPASTYGTPQTWDEKTLSPEGFYQVGPFPFTANSKASRFSLQARGQRDMSL